MPSVSRPQSSHHSSGSRRRGRQHQQQQALAEVRVREQNLQQQQRLARVSAKFERDRGAWGRENDKRQRGVLIDLARMLDTRLSPTIDDWFAKRRVRQVSRDGHRPARKAGDAKDDDNEDSEDDDGRREAAEERRLDRQRLLEMKSRDWCGVTSVAMRQSAKQQSHYQQQLMAATDADTATEVDHHHHQDAGQLLQHRHHQRGHHKAVGRPRTAAPVLLR